jgi:hypothetical protein
MDGSMSVSGQQVEKGDALSDADAPLPPLCSTRDTTLVAFLVDLAALASRLGQSKCNDPSRLVCVKESDESSKRWQDVLSGRLKPG